MATRLGLGQLTGIDLTGERPGLIPTREWKKAVLGQSWAQGETLITGIGQGFVLATPLQLAVMVARVTSGGRAIVPRVTRAAPEAGTVQAASDVEPASLGISAASLRVVLDGMTAVVNEPGGTAYRARIGQAGWEMGGKSGSAQVRRITLSEREHKLLRPEDKPWRERENALFIAFAPVHAPRYVCSVLVEHGGGGSVAAAPIARDILIEAQKRDPLGVQSNDRTPRGQDDRKMPS